MLDWPLDSMLFDVEKADFWMPRWGERPDGMEERSEIVRRDYRDWPRLIPIFSHRYIAAEPCLPGNPVYSVYQTDIIIYGTGLADYLLAEFTGCDGCPELHQVRPIEPWHTLLKMNGYE